MEKTTIRRRERGNLPTRRLLCRALALALPLVLAGSTALVHGQAVITVNENVNFKLGVLGQFQAEWLENLVTDDNTPNLFARRVRLLFGGQVAKGVTFFVETDVPNLGRHVPGGSKNISPGAIVQDAFATFQAPRWLALDAGLMFVPFSRSSIQSAATLLPIDYGAYTFTQSGPTQSSIGRDTGFQARGYLHGNRLEFRLGAFQGAQVPDPDRSLRFTGRVQYQLLEAEGTGFFYTGTYLGTKRVAAIGAAFDTQDDYRAYDLDLFIDHPAGPGAVTAQVVYNRFDGRDTFLTLPKQDVVTVELGYFLPGLKLSPVLQVARRDSDGPLPGDETRWSIGVNYWLQRHNANIKAAYGRIDPSGLAARDQFTIQLQVFYF